MQLHSPFILKCKHYLDYFPLFILFLLFVAEDQLEHQALSSSYQMAITAITLTIFYLIVLRLRNAKLIAFVCAMVAWAILIYIKKTHVPQ